MASRRLRCGGVFAAGTIARTDEQLLIAWLAGDRGAAARLLERHLARVRGYFGARVATADAEDLAQRTFVALLVGARRFRFESNVAALVNAIARRQLFKFRRDRGRRSTETVSSGALPDRERSPFDRLLQAEESDWLSNALARIPAEQRRVIELYYWDGAATDEIAERLQLTPSTVRTRLYRARRALAQLREQSDDSGY